MHHFQIKTKSRRSKQKDTRINIKTIQIKIMAINANNTKTIPIINKIKIMFQIKRTKEGVANLVTITNKIVVMLTKAVVENTKTTISRDTQTHTAS